MTIQWASIFFVSQQNASEGTKAIVRKLENWALLRIFMRIVPENKVRKSPFSFPVRLRARGFASQSYNLIFRSNFVCRYFLRSFLYLSGSRSFRSKSSVEKCPRSRSAETRLSKHITHLKSRVN